MARLLAIALLLSVATGCSKKMPCPKIPKTGKDSSFKPAAIGEGDDTNNPNDNKANMVFGGGGLKRGKDGLVKKKKFSNLVSPKAPNRKYTKINKPGGADKTNRNYTKIDNPGDNKKPRNKYTKIDKPGSTAPARPEQYTEVDAPAGNKKKKKKR